MAASLTVRNLTKRFWGTLALDNVDVDIAPGHICALLGQNGAGKSTLIKILARVHTADSGSVKIDNVDVLTAHQSGIAFVHQEHGLVPGMSVAENIALIRGYPRTRAGVVSWKKVEVQAQEVLDFMGLDLSPRVDIAQLTVAERALVAIARAMSTQARFIVLDEPTAALPASIVDQLLETISRLRARGIGFLYVTHRIDEVFRLADTVTVLRDGHVVLDTDISAVDHKALVRAIVGREIATSKVKRLPAGNAISLEMQGVAVAGVGPIDLQLRAGEILGLVGLSGAGQVEIGRVLVGALAPAQGTMRLADKPYAPRSPEAALAKSVGFVPGDRMEECLAAELTVQENLYLNPVVGGRHLLQPRMRRKETEQAHTALDEFDVRPRDPAMPISLLSGGNQQKVVVARWLVAGLHTLVLEEPTAGVDIASKAQIHDLLRAAAAESGAVVIVSSDFDEVAQLCDRVLVYNRGSLVKELIGEAIQVGTLTTWATGAQEPQPTLTTHRRGQIQ